MIARSSHHVSRSSLLVVAGLAWTLAVLAVAQPASAQAPYWNLSSRSAPTDLPLAGEQLVGEHDEGLKGEGMIVATATNLGDANVNGTTAPVTITDQLPAGLEPRKVRGVVGLGVPHDNGHPFELSCPETFAENRVVCTFENEVPPYGHLEIRISVRVTTSSPAEPSNEVTVSGGETKEKTLKHAVRIVGGGGSTPFGVEAYELTPEKEGGEIETQAGSHPFQLTTTLDLNQGYGFYQEGGPLPQAPAIQKDLTFKLPPGLVGDPTAVPQCSGADFGALAPGSTNLCSDGTAIGAASVTFNDPILFGVQTWVVPVFNLVPAPGEPAKFGFSVLHVPIVLDTSVRTGEDYGVTVSLRNAPAAIQVLGAQVTLWGVPGAASHDNSRGWNCLANGTWVEELHPTPECKLHEFSAPSPFLDLPTSCANELTTTVTGDSWSGQTLSPAENSSAVRLSGCEALTRAFEPSLEVTADQHTASTPSGGTVEVTVPQTGTLEAGGTAEADISDTTLVLPPGVQASAGAANGLEACGVGDAGFIGKVDTDTGLPEHSEAELAGETGERETLQGELATQGFTPAEAQCPDAAKIGTVEVQTPLLPHPLTGSVYLGSQDTDPFAPPLAIYLVAIEEPVPGEGSKVLVKLAGEVAICQEVKELCKEAGQLISTFKNTPPVPFEKLKVHLFDGGRASQATPTLCGSYETTALFTPSSGTAAVEAASKPETFSSCSPKGVALPFAPSARAGAGNPQAGAFTPFSLSVSRPDGDQALTALTVHLPPGAAAMLSSVTPCPISQADAGTCGSASMVGKSTASSGLGGEPFTLPGQVYLTQGLDGAPFGISVLTNAEHVGPFDIGRIISNSTIKVDKNTGAATIATVETRIIESNGNTTISPTLPTMIKGVPVQLKQINVTVDRPNFEFNPTNCNPTSVGGLPMEVTGSLEGSEDASVALASKYGVSGCAALPFTPKLTAEVGGQGSKLGGTSFTVKVSSAPGQANIAKTFLTIPSELPARLTTIQQACPAAVFEANPAGCDEGSVIGFAVAHTPVLRSPLTGPAYLVSHGNAAFPDVDFVLQGEGVEIVLDGKTDIKKGVTYSRFETLPDAPISTFETVLPAGPHSALTPNTEDAPDYNLCGHSITMPTEITAQNGAVINQTTKLTVTGCGAVLSSKATHLTRAQKLAKALKACKKDKKTSKRLACERAARKKFAPKRSAKKQSKRKTRKK